MIFKIGVMTLVALVLLVNSNFAGDPDEVSGRDLSDAVSFMLRYGYLQSKDARLGLLRSKDDMVNAVKEVQRFAGVNVTGKINAETMKMMKTSRCGIADFGPTDMMRRRKRYAIQGSKWKKLDLTYRIENHAFREITKEQVSTTLRKAFDMWTSVSPLVFKEIHNGIADIRISFKAGQHEDGYVFDGEGGTLAHGFFPHNNLGLSGDIHFDNEEHWILDSRPEGTDFFWTATHEIGHAIGLDHSYYKDAIMFPYFQGYKADLKLQKDDIEGIQNIYGKPKNLIPTTVPPTIKVPGDGPSPCETSLDAAFHSKDGNTYFFKEMNFWRLDKYNRLSEALKIAEHWPNYRARKVQAAYTRRDGKTVLFKGRRYWVFEGTKYIEGPKIITDYGLPLELKQLDAVFVWGPNGKTYFFKGHQYWRYNEVAKSLDPGYPRNISVGWGAVPYPIDSVMTWKNSMTYFFKGLNFNKYDFYQRQNYKPENIGRYFMNCADTKPLENKPNVNSGAAAVLAPLFIGLLAFAVAFASL